MTRKEMPDMQHKSFVLEMQRNGIALEMGRICLTVTILVEIPEMLLQLQYKAQRVRALAG